jgi:RhoGAP domain
VKQSIVVRSLRQSLPPPYIAMAEEAPSVQTGADMKEQQQTGQDIPGVDTDDQPVEDLVAVNNEAAQVPPVEEEHVAAVAVEEAPAEQAPVEQAAAEQAPAEQAPVEEAPVEEAPVEEAPVEEAPVEEAPVEEAPVEEAPVEEAAAEEAPVEEAPVEQAPAEEAPVEQAAAEEAPVEEAPAEEAPVEEAPAEDAPAEQAAAEQAPVEEAPVEEAPVEEAPVEEAPVEEAPVELAPVEQAPVEQAPVEQAPPAEDPEATYTAAPARPARDDSTASLLSVASSKPPPLPPRKHTASNTSLNAPAPLPRKKTAPPPPVSSEAKAKMEKIIVLKHYLKQAMEAKDRNALRDTLAQLHELNVDGSHDDLVYEAETLNRELADANREEVIGTLQFYLKQAIEARKRPALQLALEQAQKVEYSGRMHADFAALIEEGQKVLAELERENNDMAAFYLKQGIQMRNRNMLKEAVDKVAKMENTQHIPEPLLQQAQDTLRQLDAENLVTFYLTSATEQKDLGALDHALQQARQLNMNMSQDEFKKAQKLAEKLRAKHQRKGSRTGRFRSIFSRKKRSESTQSVASTFGGDLHDVIDRSKYIVPQVLVDCVQYLHTNGLKEPGLFRVPGNKDTIDSLRSMYQKDDVKIDASMAFTSVHDAAGLLKDYLRSLPEPLIPFSRYKEFLAVAKIPVRDASRLPTMAEKLSSLPEHNKNTLNYLMFFLHELTEHEADNKMNGNNVAIVFAPNLLRPEVETPESMLTEMQPVIGIIASMVTNPKDCFGEPLTLSSLEKNVNE